MSYPAYLAGLALALSLPFAHAQAPKEDAKAKKVKAQQISRAEAALAAANGRRSIECRSKAQCIKAFPLAERYAKERSDPTPPAKAADFIKKSALALAVSVYPVAGPDGAAIISLNAQCDGLLGQGDFAFFECVHKVADAYNQFRPVLESALDQPG